MGTDKDNSNKPPQIKLPRKKLELLHTKESEKENPEIVKTSTQNLSVTPHSKTTGSLTRRVESPDLEHINPKLQAPGGNTEVLSKKAAGVESPQKVNEEEKTKTNIDGMRQKLRQHLSETVLDINARMSEPAPKAPPQVKEQTPTTTSRKLKIKKEGTATSTSSKLQLRRDVENEELDRSKSLSLDIEAKKEAQSAIPDPYKTSPKLDKGLLTPSDNNARLQLQRKGDQDSSSSKLESIEDDAGNVLSTDIKISTNAKPTDPLSISTLTRMDKAQTRSRKTLKTLIFLIIIIILGVGGTFGGKRIIEHIEGTQDIFLVIQEGEPDDLDKVLAYTPESYNQNNSSGKYPIHVATDRSIPFLNSVISFLDSNSEYDIDIAITKGENEGKTAFHYSISENKKKEAELLLKAGADINKVDKEGFSPLITAVEAENTSLIRLLTKNSVDTNLINNDSDTALIVAVKKNNHIIAGHLIFKKADIDVLDKQGVSLLHLAVNNKNTKLCQILIDKGIDINVTDRNNQTALVWSVNEERYNLAKLLIQNGAKINIMDKSQKTALSYAYRTKNLRMINLLKEYGGRTGKDIAKDQSVK
ncbi:MAG: ankyrin repeat domain-containing protein [Lentisphaeria bacterium]|nr:ankyrin repeat domain-containing protein [Lentisphaeria bacterium]